MDTRFAILLLILTTLLFSARVFSDEADDLLIRQVVPEGDDLLTTEHQFGVFKAKFGKTYSTPAEQDYRFRVFEANLRRAKKHQLLDPSAEHGVTRFSDLTPDEFRRSYLGLRPLRLPARAQKAPILPTTDLPTDFDWRDLGAVTPVKDQVWN